MNIYSVHSSKGCSDTAGGGEVSGKDLTHGCNPNTQESEVGGLIGGLNRLGLYSEF